MKDDVVLSMEVVNSREEDGIVGIILDVEVPGSSLLHHQLNLVYFPDPEH